MSMLNVKKKKMNDVQINAVSDGSSMFFFVQICIILANQSKPQSWQNVVKTEFPVRIGTK